MDITVQIGTEAEGAHALRVPKAYKWVSRQHAILYWHDGVATLEDRSTNGTFVNGRRITQTQVYENDTVWLGGPGTDNKCYLLKTIIYPPQIQKENSITLILEQIIIT